MRLKDKRVIWAFADGDNSRRETAIAIHRKYIPTLGVRGTPEQRYMVEVDHTVPDYGLRERYRRDMLAQREMKHV
jgi:hypothetical protein